MKKVTAKANSNIALVKYWGKRNHVLNLPAVASISITLDALFTETSVVFNPELAEDRLILNGQDAGQKETARISQFLDLIRLLKNLKIPANVESVNNFPTAAGLASSASSFACLALAAGSAAGLNLTRSKLSELARIGSGSAARSVYGGFVEMKSGQKDDGSDSIAEPLFPASHWDLSVLIVITSEEKKKTGSTDGMELSRSTSPYYQSWIESSVADIDAMRSAITQRDFEKTAEIAEFSCLKMHALAMASNPGLIYWNGTTIELIHEIRQMRSKGLPVFFTIDAGPQVKAICPASFAETIKENLLQVNGIKRIIHTALGGDAEILKVEECK